MCFTIYKENKLLHLPSVKTWNMCNAWAISLNLFPATSNAESVQIDCHPADDTAELSDRNFFSCSGMSVMIFLHMLSWCYPAVQLMFVVCCCTLWIWGNPKKKVQWRQIWCPRWQFHRTPSTNPTSRKKLIQQLADILSQVRKCSILLKEKPTFLI